MFSSLDLEKLQALFTYNVDDKIVFNSGVFFFFFTLFLLVYQFLYNSPRQRVIFVTLFSIFIAYKACGNYVVFILLSAVIDFSISNWIYKTQQDATTRKYAKPLLILSLVLNLGFLAYFKYTDFFIEIINGITQGQLPLLKIALPVAISFYTFENISYTIDVYRGKFKPINSLLDYTFFLSFFPKLMMGPIVRASDFIPQIRKKIDLTQEDLGKGLYLILTGLFKKVVISDYLHANLVETIFADPSLHTGLECLLAVYGYALVIYCDFSGYSDMAIGMAKWMGIDININFDAPYQSKSITEFWRRWHMSLSNWLRDYLYISMGGNREGTFKQYRNLFLTMLFGGLWHGASWNFVLWGALHGVALGLDKVRMSIFPDSRLLSSPVSKFIAVMLTFHFVCFCWIFFKAETFEIAFSMLHQIGTNFNLEGLSPLFEAYKMVFGVMVLGYILHFIPTKEDEKVKDFLVQSSMGVRIGISLLVILIVVLAKQSDPIMPIYLQF